MTTKNQATLRPHEGWTGEVNTGQVIRITAKSMIDFNCFDKDNFTEYAELKESDVIGWLEAGMDIDPMKESIKNQDQNKHILKVVTCDQI